MGSVEIAGYIRGDGMGGEFFYMLCCFSSGLCLFEESLSACCCCCRCVSASVPFSFHSQLRTTFHEYRRSIAKGTNSDDRGRAEPSSSLPSHHISGSSVSASFEGGREDETSVLSLV